MTKTVAIVILFILMLITYGLGFGTAKYFFCSPPKIEKVMVPVIKPVPMSDIVTKSKELRLNIKNQDLLW
jgi:hypothetical protein